MLWHVLCPQDDWEGAAFACASKHLASKAGWPQVREDGPGAGRAQDWVAEAGGHRPALCHSLTSRSYTTTTLQSCRRTVLSTKAWPKFVNLCGIVWSLRSFEHWNRNPDLSWPSARPAKQFITHKAGDALAGCAMASVPVFLLLLAQTCLHFSSQWQTPPFAINVN